MAMVKDGPYNPATREVGKFEFWHSATSGLRDMGERASDGGSALKNCYVGKRCPRAQTTPVMKPNWKAHNARISFAQQRK